MISDLPVGQRMEEIKRKLVESGVIGRVLDDFNPLMLLTVSYGDKLIRLGDQVTPAEVQRKPTFLQHYIDNQYLQETFNKRELVALFMTDPDAPGGEYLHWIITHCIAPRGEQECSWKEILTYEPPKPGAQRIVLTLFKVEYPINSYFSWCVRWLNSRRKFSTRAFAEFNVLGPPLGASFFNIKHENEEEQMSNTA